MEKTNDFTEGKILPKLIGFAFPVLLALFLQAMYGAVDLLVVGQFSSAAAVSAVSTGSQILQSVTTVITGIAMGITVLVGQKIGEKHPHEAGMIIGSGIAMFAVIAVILTILMTCGASSLSALMQAPEEAFSETTAYIRICSAGAVFIIAYNVLGSIFRGIGDSKSPMYFIAIACVVNIGLDYLFLGAWKMGAAGAALGTTLSQTISVVISLAVILRKNTGLSLKHSDFRPDRMMMGQILKIGFPVAVQDGCIQIAFLLITVIANHRGLDDAAAVGIVEKIISALFIVPSSMLATVSALSAQNIGAGKHKRASQTLRYATILTTAYGIVITILMELAVQPVMQLFTPDAAVVALGCQYMRGYIIDTIFAGIHFSFSGYFAAYGKSYIGFLHNMAAIVLLRVPGSYLASRMFPETLFPMGLAAPAGSLLSVVICLGAFFWMKRRGTIECA